MFISTRFLPASLLGLVFLVASASLGGASKFPAIKRLFDKLENYADGRSSWSGVTIEQISDAYNEFRGAKEDVMQDYMQEPLFKLVIDFVVRPYKKAPLQIMRDPEHFRNYISRIEETYRIMRPLYLGEQSSSFLAPANKFFKILHTAEGKRPRDQLTTKDFFMAKAEYKGWQAVFEETLIHEDVYAKIPELKKILNYFNDTFVKTMKEAVFPYVNKDSSADELLEKFIEEMRVKHNVVVKDGIWVQVGSEDVGEDDDEDVNEVSVDFKPIWTMTQP